MVCRSRLCRLALQSLAVAQGVLVLASAGVAQTNCVTRSGFVALGKVPTNESFLSEVSGIAWSRQLADTVWVHEDKGHGAWLAALSTAGKLRQSYLLSGASNIDWEDLAFGPGPKAGVDYIYIADTGNNDGKRTSFLLLRVEEPRNIAAGPSQLLRGVESFAFTYPNQASYDAEGLFVDPTDGTPYLVTKEKAGTTGYLFSYPLPLDSSKTKVLKFEGTFTHEQPNLTAADIAPDGGVVYLRRSKEIYAYVRPVGTSILKALQGTACKLGGGSQGDAEALSISPDGQWLITTSEGADAVIYAARLYLPSSGSASAVAAWWNYGDGHPVASPSLGVAGVPRTGATIQVATHYQPGSAAMILAVSSQAVEAGKLPLAGGFALVVPHLLVQGTLGTDGSLGLPFKIPNLAALRGALVHGQCVIADGSVSGGLALSRGLTVQIGG